MKSNPQFKPAEKSLFYPTLRNRVDQFFAQNQISKHANAAMVQKSMILLLAYILPFISILIFNITGWLGYSLWFLMGLAVAGIGMSVMHDGNHGAYSDKAWLNRWMGSTLNLLGGACMNWKIQHNQLHHTYTNIATHDDDIKERVALKFNPHTKSKKVHRYQNVYAVFMYSLLTLYWVVAKDFVQFFKYKVEGRLNVKGAALLLLFFKLLVFKVVYFSVMIGLPIFLLGMPAGFILLGFLIMHMVAGLILTVVFQLAHTVKGTEHPLPNDNLIISEDWATHQMRTTVNFSSKSWFLTWYTGGLNYQIEHHLFPKICHIHYPKIAPIVKATAAEFGVPYMENETFFQAFASHLELMKELGWQPVFSEGLG